QSMKCMQCRACGRIAILHAIRSSIVLILFGLHLFSTRVNTSTRQRQILPRFILLFYATFTASLRCLALINYFYVFFLTDEASTVAWIKRLVYRAPVNNSDEMQESESDKSFDENWFSQPRFLTVRATRSPGLHGLSEMVGPSWPAERTGVRA